MSVIKLTLPNEETIEVEKGIIAKELVDKYALNQNVVLVGANNHSYELASKINHSSKITFYDTGTPVGNKMYIKALSYIFAIAVYELFGTDTEYRIQTSINHGLYVWFEKPLVTQAMIGQLMDKMRSITESDYLFQKVTVDRLEAMEYFEKINRPEKVRLLRYNTKSYINLYKVNDHYDYFYGKLPYSTGLIKNYDVQLVNANGLLFRFPTIFHNGVIPQFINQENLFTAYQEFSDWCRGQGIVYASDLNEYITFKDINELIRIEEGRQNNDLFDVCKKIRNSNSRVKLVLVAGPTSSGKTTTSKKMATYLTGMGFKVTTLSVDDYFKNRIETPKDEVGEYDYESLAAVDIDLFNQQLSDLFEGKEVCLPKYDFLTGVREFGDKKIKLESKSILIIEGLHALNEALSKNFAKEEKFKIYVSPLAQLNLDRNSPISSSDIRLLRRIVRDRKYRGNAVGETIKVWPKVRAAEEKYVYQYQAEANKVLNTSLLYEIGVLKTLAEAYLYEVNETQAEFEEVKMLLNFLRNFLPIPTEEIPKDSLLREFIGGSCYE